MVFSSTIFLFFFLPVVLLAYHIVFLPTARGWWPGARRASNLLLLIVSLFFYAWGEQMLVAVMLASTLIDYVCGLELVGGWARAGARKPLPEGRARTPRQKLTLAISICANLSILAAFKYFNFGVDSYNAAAGALGLDSAQWRTAIQITLPIGISFYTFQSMSYTIDVYRGRVAPTRNFIDFACYVTMFPQLVAGPIVRYRDIERQLIERTVDLELFASGATRFIIGLGKKVLIANTVARLADAIFAQPVDEVTTSMAWLGTLAYTLQIYFDFSGYSDMAIGLGRMFGFQYLENFNYPYVARSIREFWRRWHISLSSWFRDYVYIPLGGNRAGKARVACNLMTVFFLCGLWHGASWTFVAWGLFHGFFLAAERGGLGRAIEKLPLVFRHAYVVLVFMAGWVIFRSESFAQALGMFGAIVGLTSASVIPMEVSLNLGNDVLLALAAGCVFSMPVYRWMTMAIQRTLETTEGPAGVALEAGFAMARLGALALILIFSSASLAAGTHNPFIYFRF